jgi:hypothetical protein
MSRPPTRQLTWQFVLRTLARLKMMTRLDQKWVAKELLAKGMDLHGLGTWLQDIEEYIRDFQREAGVDPYAHPNGNCPQCGNDIGRDHNGARYCSDKCRQRAYRVGKAKAEGRNAPFAERPQPRTVQLPGGVYELRLKRPRRTKNCNTTAFRAAPTRAEDETNVTTEKEKTQ